VNGKAVFIACAFSLLAAAAAVSSQQRLTVEQLARGADLIVKTEVKDIQTSHSRGNLTTLVTLAIEERWKGTAPGQVTVAVAGGVAGDVAQAVSGEPRFSVGERNVLFLKARGDHYTIMGGRQGKFAVKTDGPGKETAQDLTGSRRDVQQLRAEIEAAGR
jgi:hypothetical protein